MQRKVAIVRVRQERLVAAMVLGDPCPVFAMLTSS